MRKPILFIFLIFCFRSVSAQKVGLVFSGGGAKGLAHIGVLKALEENQIPIDYIVGTSMGGIVGAMYAAGYSPSEIEYVALSTDFQEWVNGRYKSDYGYFFKKKPDNPSLITAKLQIDTGFNARIRSNLINDIPLNFALLELLAQSSANARDDFDSLFVPFRCMVADVFSQKSIAVKRGSLVEAIRGTFTVPLIYRPVKVENQYVFDGGLYNNFPVNVMKEEFKPDYIIGTNVSSKIYNEYPKDSDEKLMNRFLIYLFLSNTDSTSIGKNGAYIQPDMRNFTSTNFKPVEQLIKEGYDATMADMPNILKAVQRRISDAELKARRSKFVNRNPPLTFSSVKATGVNSSQKNYVERVFNSNSKDLSLESVKKGYYKLVADDNFETVYPRISYQPQKDAYDFELQVQPQKNFNVDLGGVVSTRPLSNAYMGLQYNFLHSNSYTFTANFYSGSFYESAQITSRMDIPTHVPIFLETEFTYNHWNYLNTSQIFVENSKPNYIEQADRRITLKAGIPAFKNGKIKAEAGFINFSNQFSPNNRFTFGDILDNQKFNGILASLIFDKNSLNRRQYASMGSLWEIGLSYYNGNEKYIPGNIFRNEPFFNDIKNTNQNLNWLRFKFINEEYFLKSRKYTMGYLLEGVVSNKPLLSSFKSNTLSTPAFNPFQDSKTLYLQNFRANSYAAAGLKNIITIYKNLDLRLEGYAYLPFQEFQLLSGQSTQYGKYFSDRHYAATAGLVYHSIAGPVNLSFNYYDDEQKRYGLMFHTGFLLYNKRSFE
ncbi:patatin-like phospholipase family protein [Daejeonella oryzae]|uniref:patatin-like phospholipase family protein n=1 Tax=Daejeonella oryzae TaxID=1122943 RepID=UPI00040719CF|nr:patatin-like phospholipase family protein [Daejeonella oryzae]